MDEKIKNFAVMLAIFFIIEGVCSQNPYMKRLEIDLEVHRNDTVELKNLRLVRGLDPIYSAPGSYRVEILNNEGGKIFEERYGLSFMIFSNPPEMMNYSILYLKPEYKKEMRTLKLYHNEKEIFSQEINLCNNDGVCNSKYENFLSCTRDCPLDKEDGICIKDTDGFCDPDCSVGVDPDCTTESLSTSTTESSVGGGDNNIVYALVLVVVFVAGFLIYRRYSGMREMEDAREKREELITWIGGQLREGEDPKKLKAVIRSQGFEEELVDYVEGKLM